ncbi:MAG: protein jag [Sphaerochaetaceae bacterium]|nr:protein jag [Sphaerochaetaceae bacterium]
MYKEFEGKTEQDAINKAIDELHIEREDFTVEIIDNGKRGLFKKANVKIRVHLDTEDEEQEEVISDDQEEDFEEDLPVDEELEEKVCSFIDEMISHMGYESKTTVSSRKGRKINLEIDSNDSNIIIGRKGKNLDAIQVLANVFAGKTDTERKIIVDSEGYRVRHEEAIIKNAYRTAQQVRKTGRSRLLEPMNPYERRLVHTALSDVTGIDTKSEGEGLIKQIRIIPIKKRY